MSGCSRRHCLRQLAWGMVGTSVGTATVASGAVLLPRARFSEPSEVYVGRPTDFAAGEVSERFRRSHRIVIIREEAGIYALSAVCTHLGCIPRWQPGQDKFKCFCHGSGFSRDGVNFEGPAPRALERLKVFVDEDGRLIVDKAVRFRRERQEWVAQGAYLRLSGAGE